MEVNKLFDLTGKTAIVTGGANGIGKATAMILAKHGANISIGDFNIEDAKKTAKEIEKLGVKAIAVSCNVLKDEDLVHLIDTTSMSSINKSPNMSGYGGSKAAVNHMVANLAYDFGPEVRINAVGPGATRTAALESVLTPEIEKTMLKHTPIKRLGTADDIAGAMLYFASPISEWVSGQTIFVNGGGQQTLE